MKTFALALAVMFTVAAGADEPRGIMVTNVTLGADYVDVAWTADVPPPYRAAIHVPRASRLGTGTPVEYVDTDALAARIPMDTGPAAVFVRVESAAGLRADRKMVRAEWELYCRREAQRPMKTVTDVKVPPSRDTGAVLATDGLPQQVSLDADPAGAVTWVPRLSSCTSATYSVVSAMPASRGVVRYVTNSVSAAQDAGCPGFRVRREVVPGGFALTACAAFSASTNASLPVLVRKGSVSPFGSEALWPDAANWDAAWVMVPAEEPVPYRAYFCDPDAAYDNRIED